MGPSDQPHTGCPKKRTNKTNKNGQTWQACQRSKVVQRGPTGTKIVNLSLFDHLGPVWARLDPFRPFQTTNYFLLKPYFILMGQQIDFCLKWSKSVQVGPHGSQTAKDIYVYHF